MLVHTITTLTRRAMLILVLVFLTALAAFATYVLGTVLWPFAVYATDIYWRDTGNRVGLLISVAVVLFLATLLFTVLVNWYYSSKRILVKILQ